VRRVLAVDISPAMLEVARKNFAELGIANVELLEGDIVTLPLKSASVDRSPRSEVGGRG
jgi:ubiquinone/menaquinone biosynthesis C-methylase UbiE